MRKFVLTALVSLALAACETTDQQFAQNASVSTGSGSRLEGMISSELAERRMMAASRQNDQANGSGRAGRYSRSAASVRRRGVDCSDFASGREAQQFFLSVGGPVSDPYNLDGDGDGNACEWGRTSTKVAVRKRPAPVYQPVAPRRSVVSSGYCHIGPRGGRYTITASGRKNYGGC